LEQELQARMPKVLSFKCFKLLLYEILGLVLPGRGYKMHSLLITKANEMHNFWTSFW